MGKFLKTCGILAIALVCLAAVGLVGLVRKGTALDGESRAYVEAAIPAITTSWDRQALLDRASPALKAVATPAQIDDLFGRLAPLGAVVSFETPRGESLIRYGTVNSETARYVTKAKFQNGDALVSMALVKSDGRWMIEGFHVETLGRLTATRV